MKVLHIVPAAFGYFDDIKKQAFKIIEEQVSIGLETEVITLQYGDMGKKERGELSVSVDKSHNYVGSTTLDEAIKKFSEFDLVHLHCPFMGGAKNIIRGLSEHNISIFCTYYRDVKIVDLYSLVISLYNKIFLPKIFALAKFVVLPDSTKEFAALSSIKNTNKVVSLDSIDIPGECGLEGDKEVAAKLAVLYNNLALN